MKIEWKEQTKDNIIAYTVSGTLIAIVVFLLKNWSGTSSFIGKLWSAILPFLFGFCIAFILLPLRKMVENHWLKNTKWKEKTKRKVAVAIALVLFICILILFFVLLIPQLTASGKALFDSMDSYMSSAQGFFSTFLGDTTSFWFGLYTSIKDAITNWASTGLFPTILNYSYNVVMTVFNFFVGVIVAMYILLDQEKFIRQSKKFVYATMRKDHADYWARVGKLSAYMFNHFIFGKALDSLIVGIVCWIVIGIMRIPYAPLIAFVIGVTNMIPVFGPFIGAIPCVFILLIINPVTALEFAIFILILQQIDGNILGPYILGNSMGLPTLWVMFSIIVGGALFGVVGMILGVPLFSVIYVLVREKINTKLKEKNITIE